MASKPLPERHGKVAGVLIDWDLLRDAAAHLAEELTKRHATASILRGASERSATLRTRLIDVAQGLEVDRLDSLLDRLEQVRVEDFDTHAGYGTFMSRLRKAERATDPDENLKLLQELVDQGLAIFGEPQQDDTPKPLQVKPEELRLTAWEILVTSPRR